MPPVPVPFAVMLVLELIEPPLSSMPGTTEPDATAVTVSVVPEIEPVKLALPQ